LNAQHPFDQAAIDALGLTTLTAADQNLALGLSLIVVNSKHITGDYEGVIDLEFLLKQHYDLKIIGPNACLIAQFINWGSRHLPATTAVMVAKFPGIAKALCLERWVSDLADTCLQVGIDQPYQVDALMSYLNSVFMIGRTVPDWLYHYKLAVLTILAQCASFKPDSQATRQREDEFRRIFAGLNNLNMLSDDILELQKKLLVRDMDFKANDSLAYRYTRVIQPLFEMRLSRANDLHMFGTDMRGVLIRLDRLLEISDRYYRADGSSDQYTGSAQLVCKVLNAPEAWWEAAFKGGKRSNAYQRLNIFDVFLKDITAKLSRLPVDPDVLRASYTNMMIIAANYIQKSKIKEHEYTDPIFKTLSKFADFDAVRAGVGRGANKRLGDFAIRLRPDLIKSLTTKEVARKLEQDLGL
jgi:hypothetical protein